MLLHSNPPSRNIIPSSGAIHTTNAESRRTFYYSSLVIDNSNGSHSSKARWKVYVGDIVAVAKSKQNESAQDVIESWKPNHYVKKSPGWKIGLVIALRKVITRHGKGAAGTKFGTGGIKFECHVQWLEKSLDLEKNEMKSANLKSIYRPYNTNSNTGSQLPHVLINCPGDYGVVSMVPTQQPNEEYNIVLPVNIAMKTNRDFMRNGVKEGEESKHELRFCCTKTRRQLRKSPNKGEGSIALPPGRKILTEREPDAWVHFNRPGTNKNSNDASDNVPPLINKIPEPLHQAWKGWLQTENAIGHTVGKSVDVVELSPEEKSNLEERLAMLGDAFMRGWNQSRRDRFNKFTLMKEEQRRQNLEDKKKLERDLHIKQAARTPKPGDNPTSKNAVEKRIKSLDSSRPDSSALNKREAKNLIHSTALRVEDTNIKRKKKELRFSADTKQPSSKANSTSNTSLAQTQNKKRKRGNLSSSSSSQPQRASSSVTSSQRKKGRLRKTEGINDDEAASTTTRDTHSTDTTLPTRGAGRKRKLKVVPGAGHDCNDNGTETTASTSKDSSGYSKVSPSSVTDALDKWKVDSAFSEKAAAFYTAKRKRCFRELRMTLPLSEPSIRCLFDEDEAGILDQFHSSNQDIDRQHFHIKIGSVVCLHYNGSKSTTNSWSPFRVPWGVAQVTNIFCERGIKDGEDTWRLTIKWFYRYPELEVGRRAKMLESMNKIDGLVETFESCDCSVEELLPAYIGLTSDAEEFVRYPRQEQGKNGFPIVRMLCQHLERSRGKMRRQSDWTYTHHEFLESLPSIPEGILPGPYKRALEKMPTQLKKSFDTWFEEREALYPSLDIVPVTTKTSYEHKGTEYVDSICMNVQKTDLNTKLRAKVNNRWTMGVGHIVAIHSHNGLRKARSDTRRWYPFQKQWCPAQIVALYKKECGTWMMEFRWFDRFKEVLQQHKDNVSHLNKPHVVFETEVYEHLPVADALPGRIILSSIENKENWDITISDTTGLPLIPRLCNHMCFDEEIDTCMDWTSYDLNLSQIPPGLSRGLLLSPRNRQKKQILSILSRYYIKTTKNRAVDPDHSYFQRWRAEENILTQNNNLIYDRFVPDNSEVDPGPHLLTVSLYKGSQDFFKSVSVRSPTKYLVSTTMEMKRRKKNCFDCSVGDIVCYFDKNARTSESYTSPNHLKHPWYPFQIPWSYGQILTIYKESKEECGGTIKIEMRRFYKLSEIPDEAKEFLPMYLKGSREEIFESNDVVTALDASYLLGTATLFLGNHTSSGDDNLSLGRRKDVTSCRCKFFYLHAFRRLQPIYWSSLYPKGWHHGLQQRGYKLSASIKKHQKLRQLLVKHVDKGPIIDMVTSCKTPEKEGFCARRGKSIQSSTSQRSFYSDIALHPQWSLFCASEYLSLAESSDRKEWTLHVGDIIAIKDSDNTQAYPSFPFAAPWFPGQILAIFNESKINELNIIQFEIRCLKFEKCSSTIKRKVTVCHPSKIITLKPLSLLGPLTIYFPDAKFETDFALTQAHLPLSEFMATESLKIDTESTLALSKLYTSEDRKILRQFATRTRSPFDAEDDDNNTREYQSIYRPFRVDEFNLRAFYSEISVLPQCKIFRGGVYEPDSTSKNVKVGDTIRVRFEGAKRLPYDCNWSVAEVVAIFEKFESKDELDRINKSNPTESRQKKFKIEIRWLYERRDISMSISTVDDQSELNEVFETDHCQVVDARVAVLGHVQLVENIAHVKNDGMDYFLCTRFWSTKRRTLIPCSGLDGRMKRGMIYSTLGSEDDIKKPLPFKNETTLNKESENWKDSMANLICKLTLKDASKNAYTSGEALVGRERELSQILSFLRGAFFEDRRSAGYKSSMFLAGPPGVVSCS